MRQVKDEDEIRRLRRAVAITSDALLEGMAATQPGMREYELEALIEYGFHRRGAELVVIDVGAEYGYYSADLARTLPVSGQFSPRQRQLYDLVLGAQEAAIAEVRPGGDLLTLDRTARAYLRNRSGSLCGGFGCERYFIHGLSHWLGMDVHDGGSYSRRLEPGMVLTVEPGIYLAAESLGIRIEDVVLVTPQGGEVLSSGLPRSAAAVERAMAR